MKTRDGYPIHPGMWIHNTSGVYRIRNIRPSFIEIQEVLFDSPNADEYGSIGTDTLGEPIYKYSEPYTILPKELINYRYK